MEVKTRRVCEQCGGTGKNGLSWEEALSVLRDKPTSIVLTPCQFVPASTEERIRAIQKCGADCKDGYVESWIGINDLLNDDWG